MEENIVSTAKKELMKYKGRVLIFDREILVRFSSFGSFMREVEKKAKKANIELDLEKFRIFVGKEKPEECMTYVDPEEWDLVMGDMGMIQKGYSHGSYISFRLETKNLRDRRTNKFRKRKKVVRIKSSYTKEEVHQEEGEEEEEEDVIFTEEGEKSEIYHNIEQHEFTTEDEEDVFENSSISSSIEVSTETRNLRRRRKASETIIRFDKIFGYPPSEDCKIIMLGKSATGKTSLLLRFKEDIFRNRVSPTVGLDMIQQNFICGREGSGENRVYMANIFDTAGQERFGSLLPNYTRGVKGVIYVMDPHCFDIVDELKKVPMLLVANKVDLCQDQDEKDEYDELICLAREFIENEHDGRDSIKVFKCSCKEMNKKEIDPIFQELFSRIVYLQNLEDGGGHEKRKGYDDDDDIVEEVKCVDDPTFRLEGEVEKSKCTCN